MNKLGFRGAGFLSPHGPRRATRVPPKPGFWRLPGEKEHLVPWDAAEEPESVGMPPR